MLAWHYIIWNYFIMTIDRPEGDPSGLGPRNLNPAADYESVVREFVVRLAELRRETPRETAQFCVSSLATMFSLPPGTESANVSLPSPVEVTLNELSRRDPAELLTPSQVGKILHVQPKAVGRWHKDGLLRGIYTPGGHGRFPVGHVMEALWRANQQPE